MLKKNIKTLFIRALPAVTISALLVVAMVYAVTTWEEPNFDPPECPSGQPGCDPPLNVGPLGQSKIGGLILNTGGAITGLVVDQGNVGIGTQVPGYNLDINGVLRLRPTTEPPNPTNGVIYYDSGTNKIRFYQNGSWQELVVGGAD